MELRLVNAVQLKTRSTGWVSLRRIVVRFVLYGLVLVDESFRMGRVDGAKESQLQAERVETLEKSTFCGFSHHQTTPFGRMPIVKALSLTPAKT